LRTLAELMYPPHTTVPPPGSTLKSAMIARCLGSAA
jgi:hypothetical protein